MLNSGLTPQDWHIRFTQQALWTKDLRDYIYQQIKIEKAERILEVGCGTGAILQDYSSMISFQVGLDILRPHLKEAMRNLPNTNLLQGDAHTLPYCNSCFDLTLCHFFLLWVDDPITVVREMVRVTRPSCPVLALAEPDYGGRIDFPQQLSQLGEWQTKSLIEQGADPQIGRKLGHIFHQAGLQSVRIGVLGGQWSSPPDWNQWKTEWKVLEADLKEKPNFMQKLGLLKDVDRTAHKSGERVLFVPTFYAWGLVPNSEKQTSILGK